MKKLMSGKTSIEYAVLVSGVGGVAYIITDFVAQQTAVLMNFVTLFGK